MLGCEQRREPDSRCVEQQVDRAPASLISPGVIRDEPHTLATDEMRGIFQENRNARCNLGLEIAREQQRD